MSRISTDQFIWPEPPARAEGGPCLRSAAKEPFQTVPDHLGRRVEWPSHRMHAASSDITTCEAQVAHVLPPHIA